MNADWQTIDSVGSGMSWNKTNGFQPTVPLDSIVISELAEWDVKKYLNKTLNIFNKSFIESTCIAVPYDDSDLRRSLWRSLFGNTPIPTVENGAVNKYFGILDRQIIKDFKPDDIMRILKQSRGR